MLARLLACAVRVRLYFPLPGGCRNSNLRNIEVRGRGGKTGCEASQHKQFKRQGSRIFSMYGSGHNGQARPRSHSYNRYTVCSNGNGARKHGPFYLRKRFRPPPTSDAVAQLTAWRRRAANCARPSGEGNGGGGRQTVQGRRERGMETIIITSLRNTIRNIKKHLTQS